MSDELRPRVPVPVPPPPIDPRDGAHESLEIVQPTEAEIERVWQTYWRNLLTVDGVFAMAQLKGELFDAWFLVNNARLVYRHVTGGITDNLCASAEGIIAMADRRVAQLTESLRGEIDRLERELEAERQRDPRRMQA